MTGDTSQSDSRLTRRQRSVLSLVAVVCIVLSGAALVAAQQQTFRDDFSDGDTDGWESDNPTLTTVAESQTGTQNSLYFETSTEDRYATWVDARQIDMGEEFNITGTFKPGWNEEDTEDGYGINLGLVGTGGNGSALVHFSEWHDQTWLATGPNEDTPTGGTINTDFNGQWVEFHIWSEEGSDILNANVWQVGGTEPSSAQLQRDFEGVVGNFSIGVGNVERTIRTATLDVVEIEGTQDIVTSDDLSLDVPGLLRPNTTSHYTVEANQSGTWEDVTDEAEITVEDPNAATFYPSNGTVVATNDTDYANVTNVTAEYDGLNQSEKMVVARPTVENLDLLPTWWKVNATVGDGMMLWLIVATLAAVVATRAATPFAGVGAYVMFMIAGWMTGSVSDGVMVATILTGLFLGMNLAANVDTTIRGSG